MLANNRIAEILERLAFAPTRPVLDTNSGDDYPTQPMSPVQIQSLTLTANEQRVWKYLENNPSAINLSVRKLGEATETNKTTAASVLARYKKLKGE